MTAFSLGTVWEETIAFLRRESGLLIPVALAVYGPAQLLFDVGMQALMSMRGAGEAGLCRNEVRDRLVSQVPDVTRLLDRMEEAGLVARERGVKDRRLVTTTITPEGKRVLAELDEPVRQLHSKHLGHMNEADLRTLIELLARARSGV